MSDGVSGLGRAASRPSRYGNAARLSAFLLVAMILGACTVTRQLSLPATSTATFAGTPLPGRYAVHVDTAVLDGHLKVGGACKDTVYAMNMRGPFEARLRAALERRLQAVQFVPRPLDAGALSQGGYAGQIVLIVEDVSGRTEIRRPSLTLKAGIDLSLSLTSRLTVEDTARRYRDGTLATKADTRGEALLDVCESVADTMGVAFAEALDGLVAQTDEALEPLRATRHGAGS
jgi:hypothetical protein